MATDAYRREALRLSQARFLVGARYPRFGVNKQREITRLLYEISKREGRPPAQILPEEEAKTFQLLKSRLLRKRYPQAGPVSSPRDYYLPGISLAPESECAREETPFRPRKIVAEDAVADSALARRFRSAFPGAEFVRVESPSGLGAARGGGPENYNRRRETVLIVRERFDFLKSCPCTRGAVACGYQILNLGFGCLFDCTYCFLQLYSNVSGLVFPANLEDFFSRFEKYRRSGPAQRWQRGPVFRIGTGEFSDSLMLDRITGYSLPLVEFFRNQPGCIFEFKTKSAEVDNLLRADPGGTIVAAWSLNPPRVIKAAEPGTASLPERIAAARKCAGAGYRLAFHFDPILDYPGWEKDYRELLESLSDGIPPRAVSWISLGTLRFHPELKPVIENRFPANTLLDAELVLSFDGKLRYPDPVRLRIYRAMVEMLNRWAPLLPLYLCMENAAMWKGLGLKSPFRGSASG